MGMLVKFDSIVVVVDSEVMEADIWEWRRRRFFFWYPGRRSSNSSSLCAALPLPVTPLMRSPRPPPPDSFLPFLLSPPPPSPPSPFELVFCKCSLSSPFMALSIWAYFSDALSFTLPDNWLSFVYSIPRIGEVRFLII